MLFFLGVMVEGVLVHDPGHIGYFTPSWSVSQLDGDYVLVEWGTVKNTHATKPTTVYLDLVFSTFSGATESSVTNISCTIGDEVIDTLQIDLTDNLEPTEPSVVAEDVTFWGTNNWYVGGEAEVQLLITVPRKLLA